MSISSIKDGLNDFNGEIILPNNTSYNEARSIWNGMIDKKPVVILKCSNKEDVIKGIKLAQDRNLPLSVKGGGHGIAGFAVADNGVMLDLSLMKKVSVNDKIATVEAGCLLSDLDTATIVHGLAVPSGIISHTGVSGITLGGGFGWISRKFGLSVDNLISAEVVTSDGRVVTASKDDNPDLFWAIRGGGGNFGIVTSFKFRCSEIGKEVYSGIIAYPFENAKEYIRFHRDFVKTLPDEMTLWMVIRHAPPLPFLPENVHGKLVVITPYVYLGEPSEGENILKPVMEKFNPHGSFLGMHGWTQWQSAFDALNVHGLRNYWKSHYYQELSDDVIDVILDFASRYPTPLCETFIPHFEGLPSRISDDETAYAHRKAPFAMNVHTRWQNKEDDERCINWAREFFEATKPFSKGVYVNFLSDEGKDRVKDAYSEKTWKRLVDLKKKYDPDNFFRSNQNISPE